MELEEQKGVEQSSNAGIGFGIASLVFGIISIVTLMFIIISVLTAILAIVFGFMAMKKGDKLGVVTVSYDGRELTSYDVYLNDDIEYYHPVIYTIMGLAIVLMIISIILIKKNKRRSKQKKRKKRL